MSDTYVKANSFAELAGAKSGDAANERIRRISDKADAVPGTRGTIIKAAIDEILNPRPESEFHLTPFVAEEIRRLRTDDEVFRYLYYRYRYDVYPNKQKLDGFPPCVQIEPTSICNYRCVFCYQTDKMLTQGRHGHMGMMTLDTFKHIVDQIEDEVEAVTLASRGEPLMAREIVGMLEYLAGKFLGLKINTNASFMNEEKIHAILAAEPNTVVFSADAADPDLYATLRVNGKLDVVLANIRMFNKIKQRDYPSSRTVTRVSGVKYADEQVFSDIEAFWHDLVDQVAFVKYNPWENPYDDPKNGIETPCSDLWRRTFVWWDGRVNPCDVDYRSHLSVGNAELESISEIWTGPKYQALREQHLNGRRQSVSPCKSCTLI